LYNRIDELEREGLIKTTKSYSVKRFSRRIKPIKFNYDNPEYIQFCHKFGFDDGKSKFNFNDEGNRKYYSSYMERVKKPDYCKTHETIEDRYIDFIDAYLYEIIEYINSHSHPDLQLVHNLRFIKYEVMKWGKKRIILEFKGRNYNKACLTKSGKDGKEYKKKDKRPFRKDFLEERGMSDYVEIHDIESQIPRLTGFLNGKIDWDSKDVYELIKTQSQVDISRNDIKSLFM
jgi:hypothetical protein